MSFSQVARAKEMLADVERKQLELQSLEEELMRATAMEAEVQAADQLVGDGVLHRTRSLSAACSGNASLAVDKAKETKPLIFVLLTCIISLVLFRLPVNQNVNNGP